MDEAKTLARFNHPNVVQVLSFFEANSTAYMVMRYEDGKLLNETLKTETLTEEELTQNILLPLLDGLKQVHEAGFLHRDIKPGNIYMRRSDETPVLLDFGAARNALGSKSKSLTSIVTPGYAPFEQYHSDGNQGPWSDIYALGAVAYRIVTGNRPPEAPSRLKKDKMIPAVEAAKGKYSERLLKAIDYALAVDEEDRPQTIEEWRQGLTSQVVVDPPLKPVPEKKRWVVKAVLASTVLLLAAAIIVPQLSGGDYKSRVATEQAQKTAEAQRVAEKARLAQEQARKDEAIKLQQQRLAKEEAQKVAKEKARKVAVEKAKRVADKKRKLAASIPKRLMTSVGPIAFSPDGSKVLYGSGRVIKLMDTITRKLLRTFEGHKETVHLVAFSPDGKRILSGSYDGTVKLWNVKGQLLKDIAKYKGDGVASIAFSPDGTKIISSGMHERSFRLMDLDRDKVLKIFKESDFNEEGMFGNPAHSIVFSPDGRKILTGIQNKISLSLNLWNLKGKLLRSFKFKDFSKFEKRGCRAGEEGGIDSDGIIVHSSSFSLDGSKVLVTVGYANGGRCQDEGQPNVFENVVHQFDVSSGKELFAFEGHEDESFNAVFSPDGSRVVSGGADRTIRIWDASNGKLERTLKFEGDVYYVAFSPDGSKLVSWNENNIFRIIDLNKGTMRKFK